MTVALNESSIKHYFSDSSGPKSSGQECVISGMGYLATALDVLVWLPNLSSVALLGINHIFSWDKLLLLGNVHIISLVTSFVSAYLEARALFINLRWSWKIEALITALKDNPEDSEEARNFLSGFFSAEPGLLGIHRATLTNVAGVKAAQLAEAYFKSGDYLMSLGVLLVGLRSRRPDLILRTLVAIMLFVTAAVALAMAVFMPHISILLAAISLLCVILWVMTLVGEHYKADHQKYVDIIAESESIISPAL